VTRWRQPEMWISCPCGRNLARAAWRRYRTSAGDNIRVETIAAGTAEPFEHRDPDRLYPQPSYKWHCRCGRDWAVRHERIATFWHEHIGARPPERVISAILGRDL
jgi:hypothetical protein